MKARKDFFSLPVFSYTIMLKGNYYNNKFINHEKCNLFKILYSSLNPVFCSLAITRTNIKINTNTTIYLLQSNNLIKQ